MGTTTRFALPYPELTDAPDGPTQIETLATDVDGLLARAVPCLSSARPSGVGVGFLIHETDTGLFYGWDGTTWVALSGGGGGGGGVVSGTATYSAVVAQSVASGGGDVPIAFGTIVDADALVVRATSGAGHKFTLQRTAPWLITATARFATTASAAERTFDLKAGAVTLAKQGGPGAGVPFTANLTGARTLTTGTEITVVANQYTGAGLLTEPEADGKWCHIDFLCLG